MLSSRNFIQAAGKRYLAQATGALRPTLPLHSQTRQIHLMSSRGPWVTPRRSLVQHRELAMTRQFSSSGSSGQSLFENGKNMTAEEAQRLNQIQASFVSDDMNARKAYEYLHELNRHQFYMTVVKEYDELQERIKNGRGFAQSSQKKLQEWESRLESQYQYAMDHLNLRVQQAGADDMGGDAGARHWVVDAGYGALLLAAAYGLVWYFEPFAKTELGGTGADKFKFEIKKAHDVEQRLDDVKGIDEIKSEIRDLIKMIGHSADYAAKGAKLYRGVLLSGRPGTGKTLLARAIAGEAGVNFIYCTGSNFDEMFVGLGAKRVRELFAEARKNTPCIIFIDEIDSLMSASRRYGSEHSSSRGTINQLLAEMDGFEKHEDIVVIGATNHEDSLDPAAVRPGRFDKKIHVPLPDVNGRKDILDLYLGKITKDEAVESKKIATMTPGFSGAEIQNLVNTAITQAVHDGKEHADLESFEYARDRLMMGIERKKLTMTEQDRLATAIHEAGHATVCYFTPGAQKLYKATIVARGGSLGATFMEPDEGDSHSTTKMKCLANIDTAMGGHVAEKLFIGSRKITTGCSSDLRHATEIAYRAVMNYGMYGEDVGYMSSSTDELSEDMKAIIDARVKRILEESERRVEALLLGKGEQLRALAKNLYWYDYLDAKEMDLVLRGKALDKERVREWREENASKDPSSPRPLVTF